MLENVSKIINDRINAEESENDFNLVIQEDNNPIFLNNDIKKESKKDMLYRDNPYYFTEGTEQPDPQLGTSFASDAAFNDDYSADGIVDLTDDDLTDFQEDDAFNDNYTHKVDSDFEPHSLLNVDNSYKDSQTTPVNIDPYSVESSYWFEDTSMNSDNDSDAVNEESTLDENYYAEADDESMDDSEALDENYYAEADDESMDDSEALDENYYAESDDESMDADDTLDECGSKNCDTLDENYYAEADDESMDDNDTLDENYYAEAEDEPEDIVEENYYDF